MAKAGAKSRRSLLDAARRHAGALEAAGLEEGVIAQYESALRRRDAQGEAISPAAQVLLRDLSGEIEEFQAAIRKEFPANPAFHAIFAANEPMPVQPRAVVVLGRRVADEAPDYAQNLIKYAINAATVKHLRALCDQLDRELGADPAQELRALEERIAAAARRAFEGRPELQHFQTS